MTTKIINQIVEYDNSARAWGRFEQPDGSMAVDLVKYYDDKNSAILAALPADLRQWVSEHDGEPARVLRAAVLLAEERVTPYAEGDPGVYDIRGPQSHTCNVTIPWCSCEDWRYKSRKTGACKHLYAAQKLFAEFKADCYPPAPSLWDLARSAIEEHENDADLDGLVIWRDASDTRHATLVQVKSDPYAGSRMAYGTWLYLEVSGHPNGLPVATLRRCILTDAPRWEFDCRETEYKEWVRENQEEEKPEPHDLAEMYNELVQSGEDPDEAARIVDSALGIQHDNCKTKKGRS